jgi:hypothetical protein
LLFRAGRVDAFSEMPQTRNQDPRRRVTAERAGTPPSIDISLVAAHVSEFPEPGLWSLNDPGRTSDLN